jgi:hypothetical protein
MKKNLTAFTFASLMTLLSVPCYGATDITDITLDQVDGLLWGDTVLAGDPVKFVCRLRYITGDGSVITGSTNGFRVWTSNNGLTGTFSPITWDTCNIIWSSIYDGGIFFSPDSSLGDLTDTIGIGGFALFTGGFYDGFDDTVWWVATTPGTAGDTLCIDSSYYQHYPWGQIWLWSTNGPLGAIPPGWGGPYCFHVEQCCIGNRGNVDMVVRGGSPVDIADLVLLKKYLFEGGQAPPCAGAGNVDGIGGVNVADLTYFIDYLFRGGPEPPACP